MVFLKGNIMFDMHRWTKWERIINKQKRLMKRVVNNPFQGCGTSVRHAYSGKGVNNEK